MLPRPGLPGPAKGCPVRPENRTFMLELLNPPHWPPPRGYTNCIVARGDIVFVAGQIGWTPDGKFPAKDLAGQLRQALINIGEALAPSGAKLSDIVRLTWYVTARDEYLANIKEI